MTAHPLSVLVVEDNPGDADLIREMLVEPGRLSLQIESVWQLSEAITRLERKGIDLVLLDLGLPDSQGLATFHKLRKAVPGVPVVVLTGSDDDEEAITAMRAGAQDYLVKGQISGPLLARVVWYAVERQKAEAALRASEVQYRRLFEAAKDGILILDAETGLVVDVNPFLIQMLGFSHEAFLGKKVWELGFLKGIVANQTNFAKLQEKEYIRYEDLALETADGRRIEVEFVSNVYEVNDRKVIQCNVRDITERRRVEEALEREHKLLRTLIDQIPDSIYVRNTANRFILANEAVAKRMGAAGPAALLGKTDADFFPAEQAARFAAADQKVLAGEALENVEENIVCPNGQQRIMLTTKVPLNDAHGAGTGLLGIGRDITEKKQLQTQLLRAQRLESIGALAGGIAHDLNNILAPILMVGPLLRQTASDPDSRRMLDSVEACAQRGTNIIKQLLTFARGKPASRAPVPVRHFLNEMHKLICETFPRNVRSYVNVPKDLWFISGDVTQIHQALMNLCVNARDAMPGGGTLTLAAENVTLDETSTALAPEAEPGAYVRVSVTDTGLGIAAEHLDHIFDPFFTTKEVGKGTGLGLSTVLGIMRGHGGFVRVNSRVGQGTTFELYLPVSREAEGADTVGPDLLSPRGQGEVILVVDDEATVLDLLCCALERHGYQVLTARDGAEALVLFGQHRSKVRAVITDMMMPGMDGPKLVEALRHLDGRLPILGMTGLAEQADMKGLADLPLQVLLTKPFTVVKVLAVLSQALAWSRLGPASPKPSRD